MTEAPLKELTERLKDRADSGAVSIGEIMDMVGRASYAPLILLLSVIAISPIGAIPGASILAGIILFLLGGQMLAGRDNPWMPSVVENRPVKGDHLRKALDRSQGLIEWVDRLPQPRLRQFTTNAWAKAVAAGVILMGLLMLPLALVPWGVVAPAMALVVVSLGLVGKDGLLVELGLAAMGVAAVISGYLVRTTVVGWL